jgi:hypothetical protein
MYRHWVWVPLTLLILCPLIAVERGASIDELREALTKKARGMNEHAIADAAAACRLFSVASSIFCKSIDGVQKIRVTLGAPATDLS